MNGYKMMSDSYHKLIEQGKISKEDAAPEIRVFDFLATCDMDDLYRLIDSTAFNDIIKSYMKMAIQNAGLDKQAEEQIMDQLHYLFDGKQAKEVCSNKNFI